ncbi:Holliday junction branch migration protein RuvA [Candidatus Gracilibacteria bacterium]|nr:Holliday junction branch migration protein RuvA [Candidatus Gracilibacteria bacterium]
MIAYLKGTVLELDFTKIVILTASGVGYEVLINELNFTKLQGLEEVEIHIHHHRTENFQFLFGFVEKQEKEVFEELIKINGVGGKVALNILSIGQTRLIEAVKSSDNKTIEGIKGIGKKGASKIILELADKDFVKNYQSSSTQKGESNISNTSHDSVVLSDVRNTLVAMGYNLPDIEKTLAKLPESITSINEIIPFVIKNI